MYTYVYRANRYVWNYDFSKAEEMLMPYAETNPRCWLEMATISSLESQTNGSSASRQQALERLKKSSAVVDKIMGNNNKILEWAKQTIELNKKARALDDQDIKDGKMPDIYNTKTETSTVHPRNSCVNLATVDTPLEEMSEKELIQNFHYDLKVLEAEIWLWRGITQFSDNAFLKGAYNLRKSWKAYESLLKFMETENEKAQSNDPCTTLHKNLHQAILFGVSMFYYMLSILPPAITKVLEFIGFKADRETGIEYLDYVACERGHRSTSAIFMLSVNYLFIPTAFSDKHEALNKFKPHMDFLMANYPMSPTFLFTASQYARKVGDYPKAMKYIEDAVEYAKKRGPEPNMYNYELGQCYFVCKDYEKAASIFEYLTNKEESFDVKAMCAMALAVCYEKLGQFDKAKLLLPKLPKMAAQKSRFDAFVLDKVKLLDMVKSDKEKDIILRTTLFEMLYLKRDIHHMKPEQLQGFLADFEQTSSEAADVKLGDLRAACFVIHASLVRTLGDEEKAAKLFDQAIALDKETKYEKQWQASACYERGEQEYYAGNLDKSLEYLKKADSYSKYAFEEVIRSRIKIALKTIKQKKLDQKEKKK